MVEADALVANLQEQGELRLARFTSEELLAVGADSPVPGLARSDRLATLGPAELEAALSAALRGLVARGYVHPDEAWPDEADLAGDGDGRLRDVLASSGDDEAVALPLSGDLALVVALRRSPSFVALVSEPSPAELETRGPLAHRRADAVLHGFATATSPLGGVLEERRSELGIHTFTLRTLAQQAVSLCASLEARAVEPADGAPGACETALEIALPVVAGHRAPLRLLARLDPGRDGSGRAGLTRPTPAGRPATEPCTVAELPERLAQLLVAIGRERGGGTGASTAS